MTIYKLKVEERTIKTYLRFISIKKRLFSNTMFFLKEKKTNVIRLKIEISSTWLNKIKIKIK